MADADVQALSAQGNLLQAQRCSSRKPILAAVRGDNALVRTADSRANVMHNIFIPLDPRCQCITEREERVLESGGGT